MYLNIQALYLNNIQAWRPEEQERERERASESKSERASEREREREREREQEASHLLIEPQSLKLEHSLRALIYLNNTP